MAPKTLILCVLIISLVLAQIQVEAKSCCPSTTARNIYNACRLLKRSREECAGLSGCKIVKTNKCPPGYQKIVDLKSSGGVVNEFCIFGCESSVCGALTNLQNSVQSESVNQAVEYCDKACSTICAKDFTAGVETA